jgi:hypothetical protein
MARRWVVVLAGVLVACAPRGGASVAPTASSSAEISSAEPTASPSATSALRLAITDSAYGSLAIQTSPGASCSVDIVVLAAQYGEVPPPSLGTLVAPATGVLKWTYATPRIPNSNGVHWVTCKGASTETARESKGFAIARPPMSAAGLTVRVTTQAAPKDTAAPDPSLVPLRDAALAKMRATLAAEWRNATRGLGSVQLVDQSADITVFLVAARGTSVNRHGGDGSEDIVLYVSGELGPKNVENVVATALHELGHIWCCTGDDADGGGHWRVKERDPGLYGVDKYGLMTDPVTCVSFGSVLSCPNRFSDREMRALGFATFPAPPADPCVLQGLSASAELKKLEAQLVAAKAQIDADKATLASLDAQMKALAAQYPNGLPPAQFAQYESLRAQYNALVPQANARVDAYNVQVERDKTLVTQLNALLCDWS